MYVYIDTIHIGRAGVDIILCNYLPSVNPSLGSTITGADISLSLSLYRRKKGVQTLQPSTSSIHFSVELDFKAAPRVFPARLGNFITSVPHRAVSIKGKGKANLIYISHYFPTMSFNSIFGAIYGCTLSRTRVRCSNAYANPMSLASVNLAPRKLRPKLSIVSLSLSIREHALGGATHGIFGPLATRLPRAFVEIVVFAG